MLVADVFTVVFIVIGLMLSMPASWLLAAALMPRAVESARERTCRRPIVSFIVGGLALTLTIAIVAMLNKTGIGLAGLISLMVIGAAIGMSMVGMAGLVRHLGERMPAAAAARGGEEPWQRMLRGAIVLELSFLVPLLGQFLLLPYTLLTGLGATTLWIFNSRNTVTSASAATITVATAGLVQVDAHATATSDPA